MFPSNPYDAIIDVGYVIQALTGIADPNMTVINWAGYAIIFATIAMIPGR